MGANLSSIVAYQRESELLTSERTPQAAGLFLLLIGLSGFFEYHYQPEHADTFLAFYAIQTALCGILLAANAALRRVGGLLPAAIAVWSLLSITMNAYGVATGIQPELTAIGDLMFVTALSMMMPWGMRGQLVVTICALAGFLVSTFWNEPQSVPTPYLLFAFGGGALLSIIGARSLDLHRYAIFRESTDREEEVALNTTLLAVGTTMNSSLDASDVLDRIAKTARQALGLDWTVVLLWDESRQAFRVAGGASIWSEAMDIARSLEIPPQTAPLIQRVLESDYVEINGPELAAMVDPATAATLRRYSVQGLLATTLIRGGKVVGLLAAGSSKSLPQLATRVRPLFEGIAQHAAIALDNVRLVANLKQADRLKSDFVATMSHELRTPMNVILGYSDLFIDGAFGDLSGEQRHTMQRLRDSARSLLDLINATLEVNRLEAGRSPVEKIDFPVDDLLGELRRDCEDLPRAAGVELRWSDETDVDHVRGDRRKLKIIVMNLIGNALKFTTQGEVAVRLRYDLGREAFEVQVTDTGPGISESELPEIFGMFRQAEGGQLRGGVGLGLYIVSRFVDQLGGEIRVDTKVGRGSIFTAVLPAEPSHVEQEEQPRAAAG